MLTINVASLSTYGVEVRVYTVESSILANGNSTLAEAWEFWVFKKFD